MSSPDRPLSGPAPHRSPSFDELIRAFCMASEFSLAARTSDFAYCVQASVVGAHVLQTLKVRAKAVPCSVVVTNPSEQPPLYVALGITQSDAHATIVERDNSLATRPVELIPHQEDRFPMHMAIKVQSNERRGIVDPTIGQIKLLQNVDVAVADYFQCGEDDDWPLHETARGWELQYGASAHATAIEAHRSSWKVDQKWIVELRTLTLLAIQCDDNTQLFWSRMHSIRPDLVATAMQHLAPYQKNAR